MSAEPKIRHVFFDPTAKKIVSLDQNKLESELDRIAKTVGTELAKLEDIGNFHLDSVQVTVGVKGSILVIGMDGGITLTYKKN